jgi:3-hydroxyacyl-[acyl-carrier-protein] dehydratase
MRPAPFIARWKAGPVAAGAFEAHLVLDDESLFAGHYPDAPILPGTFLVEALFQAASAALGGNIRLDEIVACRFHSPLLPGDEISARFTLKNSGTGGTLIQATASGRAPAADLTMVVSPFGVSPASVGPPLPTPTWAPAPRSTSDLDASFIHRTLPHRPPALLVDSAIVLDLPSGGSALVARKAVTTIEPCFACAEPTGNYPSTLIIESFCQACGLLRAATGPTSESRDETKVPVVAKLAGLRLLGEAVPGDVLEHQVQLVVRTGEGAVFSGHTMTSGRAILQVARVVAAQAPLSSLFARPVANS